MPLWKTFWKTDKGRRTAFCAAAVLCAAGTLLSLCLGAANLSLAQLWQALRQGPENTAGYILWYSRLPRTAACLFAGAGLAVTVCCALGLLSGWAISLASFGGAMAAVAAVTALARKTGASRTTVILSGVALNSILNALRDSLTILVPDTAMLSSEFRVGDFSSVAASRLLPAAGLILLALSAALTLCNELDVLALGEDTARSLGMSVNRLRTVFLLLAALLAGAAVSFAGLLSFVGLLVPHMGRKLVGGECRYLLPMSILLGAGLVTACDLLARLVFAPFELPVGLVLSIIGGPFFLVLLLKQKGGRRNA